MLTGSAARNRNGTAANAVAASAPPAVLMRKSLRRCRCCEVRPRPFFIVTSHGVKARALRREPRQKLFRQATFALVPPVRDRVASGHRKIVYKIICKIANSRILPYSSTPRQRARRRRPGRRGFPGLPMTVHRPLRKRPAQRRATAPPKRRLAKVAAK